MTLRLFYCERCSHAIRFGKARCRKCGTPAPLPNRRFFCWSMLAALVAVSLAFTLGPL